MGGRDTTDFTEIKRARKHSDLHTSKYGNLDEIPKNTQAYPKQKAQDQMLYC